MICHANSPRLALPAIYLPGDYLKHIKRPGVPRIRRSLVMEDLVWWMLISVTVAPPTPAHFIAVVLLFGSFWSVYEIGYWDNDLCAVRFEEDPVLTPQFFGVQTHNFALKAWGTAIVLGIVGLLCLPGARLWAGCLWFGMLLALWRIYYVFNRLDKTHRILFYLALQVFRTMALAVVIPVNGVALLAGTAQIAARFQAYHLYRTAPGSRWRDTPHRSVQCLGVMLGIALIFINRQRIYFIGWPAIGFVVWSVFLARREFLSLARQGSRVLRASIGRHMG